MSTRAQVIGGTNGNFGLPVEVIRTAIVDGDPTFRRQVKELLEQEPDIEVVAEWSSVGQASQFLADQSPDLVVLYMDVPAKSRVELLDSFQPKKRPKLLCVAPSDQLAALAFDSAAIDFVLRPNLPNRLPIAINRVRRLLLLEMAQDLRLQVSQIIRNREQALPAAGRTAFKSGTRTILVDLERLTWLEAQRDYVNLHVGRDTHCIRRTMAQLEKELDSSVFMRIHRSVIVNINHVREIGKHGSGKAQVTLQDGTELPIGNGYRKALAQLCYPSKLKM